MMNKKNNLKLNIHRNSLFSSLFFLLLTTPVSQRGTAEHTESTEFIFLHYSSFLDGYWVFRLVSKATSRCKTLSNCIELFSQVSRNIKDVFITRCLPVFSVVNLFIFYILPRVVARPMKSFFLFHWGRKLRTIRNSTLRINTN